MSLVLQSWQHSQGDTSLSENLHPFFREISADGGEFTKMTKPPCLLSGGKSLVLFLVIFLLLRVEYPWFFTACHGRKQPGLDWCRGIGTCVDIKSKVPFVLSTCCDSWAVCGSLHIWMHTGEEEEEEEEFVLMRLLKKKRGEKKSYLPEKQVPIKRGLKPGLKLKLGPELKSGALILLAKSTRN